MKVLNNALWFGTLLYASLLMVGAGEALAQAATPSAGLAAAVRDTDSGYAPVRAVLGGTSAAAPWFPFSTPGNDTYAAATTNSASLATGSSSDFTTADYNVLVYGENGSPSTRVFDVGWGMLGGCFGNSSTTSSSMTIALERYRGSSWTEVGTAQANGDENTSSITYSYVQVNGRTLVELQDGDQLRMRMKCAVTASSTYVANLGSVGYIAVAY